MEIRFAIDSNVLLYIVRKDERKAQKALALLRQKPSLSVQVLNEIVNVSRKKLKLEWHEVRTALELIGNLSEIFPLNLNVHTKALEIAEANLIGIYDACIVAAAELANCNVLYTEDFNHGQRIGGVTIHNPFAQ